MKLVHLVGFIIKKFVTMHGHMNVKKGLVLIWEHSLKKKSFHLNRDKGDVKWSLLVSGGGLFKDTIPALALQD